ncbi:MAG TPA: SH3 domain-containing protein [Blastocatellia bacterium]|nr:SH3 domain-containing protein [Blastocatellia bacterium]
MVILRSSIITLLAVAYLLRPLGPGCSQVSKLYPVDEAARDPSLFVLRARLLEAVQQRDAAVILGSLAPDIVNSFGGNGGIAEFKEKWRPEQPGSKLWPTLATVLALGGSFRNEGTFAAPYVFSRFPDQLDAFEHGVIVGDNVRVRQKATVDSPVIATMSFDIVAVTDWGVKSSGVGKQGWVRVKLTGGQEGYIASEYIRSPIDYRAVFEKRQGRWLITTLVAGD